METAAYFDNIHTHIIEAVNRAAQDVTIAVAWFTDRDIFRALCQKAARNVPVKLIVLDHAFNRGERGLPFQQLRECGGEVFLIPESHSGNIMHHKFCVIDRNLVITGSYNWSQKARENDENIVVVTGATEFALKFLDTFNQILLRNGYPVKDIPRLDAEAVIRRLELIRNLILLGEYGDVGLQIGKLRQTSVDDTVLDIIGLLEQQQFEQAAERIHQLTTRLRALATYRDPEIERLRQELRTLEFQVNALSDQKAEIERKINEFVHLHNAKLGALLAEYLRLHALFRQQQAEETADNPEASEEDIRQAKADSEQAEQDYRQYSEQKAALEQETPPPSLDAEQQAELKRLYKKASMICHPDRVAEDKKAMAHDYFVQLQNAYHANDLNAVKTLLDRLEQGHEFLDQSVTLNEGEQLRQAIAKINHTLQQLQEEIRQLLHTETWQTLSQIDDWERYFADKQQQLGADIKPLADDQLKTTDTGFAAIEADRLAELFSRHPEIIGIICYVCPWHEEMIERFQSMIKWKMISYNPNVKWTESILTQYENKLEWIGDPHIAVGLSGHEGLPWNDILIDKFIDRWDFKLLSKNSGLPWSESLIEKYIHKWDWEELSLNHALPWSELLIQRFADKWDWRSLSRNLGLPWSESLIQRFADRWDWSSLSHNLGLPWSESLIQRFADRWNCGSWWAGGLSDNQCLPWSESLIEQYAERWDWNRLSHNEGLPWSESLIEQYVERWDWWHLSGNKNLPWSEQLIGHYINRWDWACLSRNEHLPWSESLIERYENKWDWNGLSCNEGLPWSDSLIDKYFEKWSWVYMGLNRGIPWSESLIGRYLDRWDWETLSQNEALSWSEPLIEKYIDRWDWQYLSWNIKLPWSIVLLEHFEVQWNWEIIRITNLLKNMDKKTIWKVLTAIYSNKDLFFSLSSYGDYQSTYRAACCGHSRAQYNLGLMYQKGDGVYESKYDAKLWFQKAAEQGDKSATIRLNQLDDEMRMPF